MLRRRAARPKLFTIGKSYSQCLDKALFLWYIITMKGRNQLNVIPTTRKQNLAAAKACDDHYTACGLFRALQHANDMGTGEDDFDELAEHFINKQGLTDYCENGFKKIKKTP